MRVLDFNRYALCFCVAVPLLVGCGGSQPPIGAPDTMPQGHATAAYAKHGGSWMKLEATGENLLYIADQGPKDVFVYSYPQGALVGTLTGFSDPAGDCVDKNGDVWIVDTAAESVSEYAHGGSTPLQTLTLPGRGNIYPMSCSVDRASGDLAITSEFDGVYIYAQVTGTPKTYTAHWYRDEYCAYDDNGNLYVDATDGSITTQHFGLYELVRGGDKLRRLRFQPGIGLKFGYAGGVQWDGKRVAFGDRWDPGSYDRSLVYQIRQHGREAREIGSTKLDVDGIVDQFWIQGTTLIAPSYQSSQGGQVGLYNYPAGGAPASTITGLSQPVAAAVSLAK